MPDEERGAQRITRREALRLAGGAAMLGLLSPGGQAAIEQLKRYGRVARTPQCPARTVPSFGPTGVVG